MTQAATKERDEFEHAKENAKGWMSSIEEMLGKLGNDEHTEDVQREIQESVLSVSVRDDWHEPGKPAEGIDEYEILLTTGGPALRIWGRLDDYCQPSSAELQMQDWGTPWTRYPAPESKLLEFAQQFWFGD